MPWLTVRGGGVLVFFFCFFLRRRQDRRGIGGRCGGGFFPGRRISRWRSPCRSRLADAHGIHALFELGHALFQCLGSGRRLIGRFCLDVLADLLLAILDFLQLGGEVGELAFQSGRRLRRRCHRRDDIGAEWLWRIGIQFFGRRWFGRRGRRQRLRLGIGHFLMLGLSQGAVALIVGIIDRLVAVIVGRFSHLGKLHRSRPCLDREHLLEAKKD